MRNPLNTSQGKGDAERHDRKKYRKGWDEIDWGKKIPKNTCEAIQKMNWQIDKECKKLKIKRKNKAIKFKSLIEGLRRKK